VTDTRFATSSPAVSAGSALVMDAHTGEVLYSKNSNASRPIASITKLMTAVVTADAHLNMSEQITLQQSDFEGPKHASSTLKPGDKMNRAEVLLVALMKSENPAAAALARTYPGGKPAFVSAMNAKARQLGMSSTHYYESTGLDARNVSSARDLGILVAEASRYGVIRQFSSTPHYDFDLGYRVLKSNNTNALVRNGGWNINLSKTGYINEAGVVWLCMQLSIRVQPLWSYWANRQHSHAIAMQPIC
jgi:D-alanyl-D-alanine endopeptidase (penicillin-binding protein 7)